MLSNVPIAASVLPRKVSDATDEVGPRHVDRNGVGQCGEDRVEFSMPEGVSVAINGISCRVAILCTVGGDSPTILADSCRHDGSRCGGRLDF